MGWSMNIKSASCLAILIMSWTAILAAEAGGIVKKADCREDSKCAGDYDELKTEWLQCLEQAGLSEKKRVGLSAKVEVIGIRNLKKQEFLIFNSSRKKCHKAFKDELASLAAERREPETDSVKQWPAPLDELNRRLPDAEP